MNPLQLQRRAKSVDRYTVSRHSVDRYSSADVVPEQQPTWLTRTNSRSSPFAHHVDNRPISLTDKKRSISVPVGTPTSMVVRSPSQYQQHQQQQQQQQHQQQQQYNNHLQYPQHRQDDASEDMFETKSNSNSSQDAQLGEMQVKLDIAAAQLLTEEMKMTDLVERFEGERRTLKEKIRTMERERQAYKSKLNEMQWQFESVLRLTEQDTSAKVKLEEELLQLRSEIDRLHDAHEEEKRMLLSEQNSLRQQYEAQLEEIEHQFEQENEAKFKELIYGLENKSKQQVKELRGSFEMELQRFKEMVEAANSEKDQYQEEFYALRQSLEEKDQKIKMIENDLFASQKEINSLSHDFQDLAEEADRLEKELEAVTEDRDQLLRNSKVPSPQIDESLQRSISDLKDQLTSLNESLQQKEDLLAQRDNKIRELELNVSKTSMLSDEELDENKSMRQEIQQLKDWKMDSLSKQEQTSGQLLIVKKERDELKQCLIEAMQKVDELEATLLSMEKNNLSLHETNNSLQSLLLKQGKDLELLKSGHILAPLNRPEEDALKLQQSISKISQWLEVQIGEMNGLENRSSKSISSVNSDEKDAPEDEIEIQDTLKNSDNLDAFIEDPLVKILYNNIKKLCNDKVSFETQLRSFSELLDFHVTLPSTNDASDPLDKEGGNDWKVKQLKAGIVSTRREISLKEEANTELRNTLKDAVGLIKPLKDQISRIEEEKKLLQIEIKGAKDRIVGLEKELEEARNEALRIGQSHSGLSSYDSEGTYEIHSLLTQLQLRDDVIVDLKIEVAQLHDALDAQSQKKEISSSDNAILSLRDGTTLTRDGTVLSPQLAARKGIQSSNEEGDTKLRLAQSELDKAKSELVKCQIAERTLKGLLQQTSASYNNLLFKRSMNHSSQQVTSEMSQLKEELSTSQQKEKKLSEALRDAVELLKPLQNQIQKAEKEKKELQAALDGQSNGVNNEVAEFKANKLEYEKTIDNLQRYVGELERRVTELEGELLSKSENSALLDDSRVVQLEKDMTMLREKYETTKAMLDDVTETNRSLLNDLRQSEEEELEVMEEFSQAQEMLKSAREEIEHARLIATSMITKMDEMNYRENGSAVSGKSTASGKLRSLTACFRALEDQVKLAAERNTVLEQQLSQKNRLLSDLMSKM